MTERLGLVYMYQDPQINGINVEGKVEYFDDCPFGNVHLMDERKSGRSDQHYNYRIYER